MRDPLYQKILDGLGDPQLDCWKFEECACNLLRPSFPGLVQVGGRGDHGMDGAIPDGELAPYPLICTTDKRVLRNLERSLDRHLQSGGPSRKAVVATSQPLTPDQRKRLELHARQRHIVLLQIFDRPALAQLLYRDSRWRRELLNLSGDPPALTPVPRRMRPLVEIEPLGRKSDIEWLRAMQSDCVLAGQPGSGKTYLLYHLIHRLRWRALFLDVESSPGTIADALRDLSPKVVVVDDAHIYHEALERLIAVRTQTGASFSIVATTWPSGTERVAEVFGGAVPQRTLELLTRQEIHEVIRRVGLGVGDGGTGMAIPEEVMRDLIDQSANRPGLAVTLARLMCEGSGNEVLDGSALARTLLRDFGARPNARALLAALSLGGDHGMRLDHAAEHLGLGPAETQDLAVQLLAGLGVLIDLPHPLRGPEGATLSVWPRPLRWQLVKSFFLTSPRKNYKPLLARAASRADGIATLLHAKGRGGAEIGAWELGDLVRSEENHKLWLLLAQVGRDEAGWALKHLPGKDLDLAEAALSTYPEAALESILDIAGATAEDEQKQSNPWAILREWISNCPTVEQGLERRELLARVALDHQSCNSTVGTSALFVALDPSAFEVSRDPADGLAMTLSWGLLSEPQLEELLEIWQRSRPRLAVIDTAAWICAEETLGGWIRPELAAGGQVPEETRGFMRGIAAAILRDLPPLVAHSLGLTMRLGRLARRCDIELNLDCDPVFTLLCTGFSETGLSREETIAEKADEIRRVTRRWQARPAGEVAVQLSHYETEARKAGLGSGECLSDRLVEELAKVVAEPESWFDAFVERDLPALAVAFTRHIVAIRLHGWREHLDRCFDLAWPYRCTAAEQVLQLPEPSHQLMEQAVRVVEELPWLGETLALRHLLPLANLRLLLRHPAHRVAFAAAIGECNAGGSGSYTERVREEIRADWRQAVLQANGSDFENAEMARLGSWLPAILGSDPLLAFDWLERRLAESDPPNGSVLDSALARAAQVLDSTQRARLLQGIRPSRGILERMHWFAAGGTAPKGFRVG